jgi:hypothetical protein
VRVRIGFICLAGAIDAMQAIGFEDIGVTDKTIRRLGHRKGRQRGAQEAVRKARPAAR